MIPSHSAKIMASSNPLDSILFRAIKEAFQKAEGRLFADNLSFLKYFKSNGYYYKGTAKRPESQVVTSSTSPGRFNPQMRQENI